MRTAKAMAAARQEVLSLYRRVLRIARGWQAQSGLSQDTDTERSYITQEARTLFRQNKQVFITGFLIPGRLTCPPWAWPHRGGEGSEPRKDEGSRHSPSTCSHTMKRPELFSWCVAAGAAWAGGRCWESRRTGALGEGSLDLALASACWGPEEGAPELTSTGNDSNSLVK